MRLSRRGKRRLLVLMLAAVVIGAGFFAFNAIKRAQQERMAAQARAAGLDAYRAGDLKTAVDELSYYFEQNKDDLEVNLIFAEARSRSPTPGGRYLFEAADLYTSHGLELIDRMQAEGQGGHEAERLDVLRRLLNLYAQMGDRLRVEQTADALLQIDPGMMDALAAKAEVLFLGRQFVEAESVASRMVELEPENLTWRKMLLETRARQGLSSAALVEQCRQWADQYTGDARFRLLAAATLMDAGRTEDARDELRAVGHLSADSPAVLEQLVSLLDALGLRDEADSAVASAVGRFPGEWWPREVSIRRAWQNDEPERAISESKEAVAALGEEPVSVRRVEVASLIAVGRSEDAITALQPLLKISPAQKEKDDDRMWALAVSTVLRADENDWRAVSESLQMALSTAPHDPILQFLLGDASLRVGEQVRAIAAYRDAYQAAPNWSTAGVAYANALLVAGRLEESHQVARLVISRGGVERLQPFLMLAKTTFALRETGTPAELIPGGDIAAEIIDSLRQIHEQIPKDPEVSSLLVRGWLVLGDLSAAKSFVNQTIAASDQSSADGGEGVDRLLALADIARQRMPDLEEPLLDKAEEIGGPTVPLAFERAELLARRGDFAGGLKVIDFAIALKPLDDGQKQTVGCARAAYQLRMDQTAGLAALASLVNAFPNSVTVQRFALSRPQAWSDQRLIAQAMGNLHRLLGEDSLQVRLAEANFLIQHHGREPALLAKAIVSLNEVLDQAPDSLAALSLAAEALMLGEHPNPDRAAMHLERAVSLYPGEPSLLVRLISTLQRQGRFDAARSYLQSLANLSSTHPEFAMDELRLLQAQGDFETALVRASATVNDTSPPAAQLLLAFAEQRTGNLDRAEAIYARLLDSDGGDPLVLMQAAEYYATTGRYTLGLDLLEKMPTAANESTVALGGEATRALMVGVFQQRHGRTDDAGKSLREAVEKAPKSTEAHAQLALHYLLTNQPALARDQALVGMRIDPADTGLRSTYAIANLALPGADREEAIRTLREIGSNDESLLAMLELLSKVPFRNGREAPTDENLAAARRLTDAHGLFLPAWQLAVSLHMQAGRVNDAIAIARGAISRLPGEPKPAQWATQLLMQQQRWDEAYAEVQEWRRRTQADPLPADAAMAQVLIALNRAAEALARLAPHQKQLLADRVPHANRLLTLIEAQVRTGDVAAAEALITPLLAEGGQWREAWIGASGLMPAAEAERVLTSMDSGEASPSERLALSMAWFALSQRSGSESHRMRAETLATTIEHDPMAAVGAAITLGSIAEARGNLPAAERSYRSAVNAAPDNPVALNNLSFVLTTQGRAEEALPLIDKALKMRPNQPDFLDTRAAALRLLNRQKEAEDALRTALDGRPDDASLMLNLAEVQLLRKEPDDAAITLSRVERRAATLDARQQARLGELKRQLEQSADATPKDQPHGGSENNPGSSTKPIDR